MPIHIQQDLLAAAKQDASVDFMKDFMQLRVQYQLLLPIKILVWHNCAYTGHSGRDCRHRKNAASADRSVSQKKQTTEKNKGFRKKLKGTQHRQHLANAPQEAQKAGASSARESSKVDFFN